MIKKNVKKYKYREFILKVIIIYAFGASLAYFIQKATVNYTFDYGFFTSNEVSRYADRFLEVKKVLPSFQKVGYIVDETGNFSNTDKTRKMTLAQYILAPYMYYSCDDCRFYMSDFHTPIDPQQIAMQNNFELMKDFGNGVALFKKR